VKRVRYSNAAEKDLERHANMAERVYRAMREYAAGEGAHANRVKPLRGTNSKRLRVGDFRVLFVESTDEIMVTRIAPRGGAYD
jgi:mRNA interferase RelE/StbE